MADTETEKPKKEKKPKLPTVPNKIVCSKTGATKGASKDRYLRLLAKEAGIEYTRQDSNEELIDKISKKVGGGIGSGSWNQLDQKMRSTYLCREERARIRKAEKAKKKAEKAETKKEE